MDLDDIQAHRRKRLRDLVDSDKHFGGSIVECGRRVGYSDPGYVGQMLRGGRPISEKAVAKIEQSCNVPGWFDLPEGEEMPRAEAHWPFELVSQSQWERLSERQRGAVESLLRQEIERYLEGAAAPAGASRKRAR